MPAASILIKPASANCNMDCKYCFYKCLSSHREEYSKGFMSYETLDILVREAIAYADGSLTFAFQGGEPTLVGIDFFKKAIELQEKYNEKNLHIENTIQTNGLLINDEWAGFLAENNFLVGLSLDGPRNKYPFVQFIPCMDEIKRQDGTEESSSYAVESKQYGKFLCKLFDLWYADFVTGERMDIRMFSNLAQLAAGYPAEECGMNGHCTCYFVVEGDGSVYPCDFYCMDEWKLGTVKDGFAQMKISQKVENFVNASKPVCEYCKLCKYFPLCRGGCRRWREPFADGHLGLNMLCEAYQMFFEHTAERIKRLGEYIIEKMGCR